jgi:hypothetical protein
VQRHVETGSACHSPYYQVQHTISQRIGRGEYAPGTSFLETELSRELGLAALRCGSFTRLAQENILFKCRAAAFVADHPMLLNPLEISPVTWRIYTINLIAFP